MISTCIPDTDSIHMLEMNEEELKQFVDIDDYRLGAFKIESRYDRGRYLRQKCYIEEVLPEKMRINLEYLEKVSLWYDINLLFRTFIVIFKH